MEDENPSSSDNEDHSMNPMHTVLSNPLLMTRIFSILSTENFSLTQLRLVCSKWNELILTLPNSNIYLVLNNGRVRHGDDDQQTFQRFAETMDPKLARQVTLMSQRARANAISPTGELHHGWRLEAIGYKNLKHCIEEFSDEIKTINLLDTGIKINYVKVLHQLLQHHCPNLVTFKICVDSLPEEEDDRIRPCYISQTWNNINFAVGPIMSPKSKLEAISVEFLDGTQLKPPRIISGPLHDLYSSLIKASPNITKLWQNILAFPDCTALVHPKSFYFGLSFYRYDFNSVTGMLQVNFTLDGLSRMMREMSHSLEFLHLDAQRSHCGRHAARNVPNAAAILAFELPPMLKLTTFKCTDTCIFFQNERTLANASPLHVGDKLKIMEIGMPIGSRSPGNSNFMQRVGNFSSSTLTPIANYLTSLTLNGINDMDPHLMDLKSAFPALQKLFINKDFGYQSYQVEFDENETSCNLAQSLRIAQSLRLETLDMKILFPSDYLTFVNVLWNNIELFRGNVLKNLRIVGSGHEMDMEAVEDDEDDSNIVNEVVRKIREAYMAMRNMTNVTFVNTGMKIPDHVCPQIFGLIGKESLPIVIKSKE